VHLSRFLSQGSVIKYLFEIFVAQGICYQDFVIKILFSRFCYQSTSLLLLPFNGVDGSFFSEDFSDFILK